MAQYQEGQRLQGSDGKVYVVQGGVPREAQSAPQSGPPAFIPGTPKPAAQPTPFQAEDQRIQRGKADREERQWNAEHNSDGSKKAKDPSMQAYSQSAMDSFDRALGSIETLKKHPGFNAGVGMPSINPFDGNLAGFVVPGSRAAGFRARVNTLKAQVFLPMVQSMKGMGALSNAEGQKLTDAIGVLDTSVPEDEFLTSLDEIKRDLMTYRDRAGSLPKAGGARQAPQSSSKRLRYNPATGALE